VKWNQNEKSKKKKKRKNKCKNVTCHLLGIFSIFYTFMDYSINGRLNDRLNLKIEKKKTQD